MNSAASQPRPPVYRTSQLIAVWLVCFAGFLPVAAEMGPFWYFDQNGVFRISDFAYYYTICRGFWTGENLNIYTVATHVPVLSNIAGAPVNGAMPLAILPPALLIWVPFIAVSPAAFFWTYSAWTATGITPLFFAIGRVAGDLVKLNKARPLRLLPVLLVFFASSTFVTTVILGQTSLYALGLILILILRFTAADSQQSRSRGMAEIILLFLLSIKVHYLVAAAALFAGFKRYRQAAASFGLIICASILLTPLLGLNWAAEYRESLALFFSDSPSALIAASFTPEKMVLFKSTFSPFIGNTLAFSLTLSLFLLYILAALYYFTRICRLISPPHSLRLMPFMLVITAYLLFTPYMGPYEDLLILAPFGATALVCPHFLSKAPVAVLLTFSSFLVLNHGIFQPSLSLLPLWSAKFVFLTILLVLMRKASQQQMDRDQRSIANA